MGANPMGYLGFTALLAGGELRGDETIMGPAFIPPRLRMSSLGVGHGEITSFIYSKIFQTGEPGVRFPVRALANFSVQIFSASWA